MGNTSIRVKYAIIAGGILMLVILCLPVCSYNILSYDLLTFNGFKLMFGKTINFLGQTEKISGSSLGMFLFLPPLGLILLTLIPENNDDESRGVFAIALSVLYLGFFLFIIYSMKSIFDTKYLGLTFMSGFWANIAIILLAILAGCYALYLGLRNDNLSRK